MATASPSGGPVELPLVLQPDQRGFTNSIDAKLVDAYIEKDAEDRFWINKRPGMIAKSAPLGTGVGQGIYYGANGYYGGRLVLQGSQAFYNSVLVGTISTIGTFATYWFNTTLGVPNYAYFSNGLAAYTYSSAGTFAKITDVNYPPVTVPGSAYLDGTLYVMDSQAKIWGSNLNDQTTWSALNVIQAQIEPDFGVAIAKQLIYVVALKQYSTEFFYDAANPVGTPLLPVQNAKIGYGCAYALSVQNIDDVLIWVATTKEGGLFVGECRGMKFKRISTPMVDRFLATIPVNTQVASISFRLFGHTFYGLIMPATFSVPNQMLVYDLTEQMWALWNNPLGIIDSSVASSSQVAGQVSPVFQSTTGAVFGVTEGVPQYTDTNATLTYPIVAEIVTPNFSGGTKLRKVLSRLRLVADQNSAGSVQIRWSDDDYKNWSEWWTVNLAEENPQLTDLGTFRKRAFHVRHLANTPFRIRALELELLLGSI